MAQATTYNVAGNREQLTDLLTLLEPETTPISSMIPKTKATATFVEFQVDNLSAPSFDGVSEGEDISAFSNKAENRARLGNYIQIFRREWKVSDVQQLVSTAGVPNEAANSSAKCLSEMKLDIESAVCSDQDRQAEDGVNVFKTRGLGDWIDSAGPSDVPAAYRVAAGQVDSTTMANTTESTFNSTLQSRYEQVGSKDDLYLVAGPTLKRTITFFSRADTSTDTQTLNVTQPASDKALTLTVQRYDGDYGLVHILPSMFNGRTSGSDIDATGRHRGYLFSPSHLGLGVLQAESNEQLQDESGGKRGYCKAMVSLIVKSPLGLCKFDATS